MRCIGKSASRKPTFYVLGFIILPLGWLVHHIHAKHVFKHLIHSLCLTISLRMVGSAEVQLRTKYANNPYQKLELNLTSLSETIVLGNPCNLKISFMKMFAMSSVLCIDFTGIKCASFINFSTTTMIESCCLQVIDNLVMKSMEITSHLHSGTGKGCNKPAGC